MTKPFLKLGWTSLLALATLGAHAQATAPLTGTSYAQDFSELAATGTANTKATLPLGWDFVESGTNADQTYATSTGSSTAGNTYSFGASGSTNRAFGSLQSGSVVPTIGGGFVNNTGATLTSITVTYTGQTWRIGTINRTDRLDFQYSTDATSIGTGTWTGVAALSYTNTAAAATGVANPTQTASITSTITGLNLAAGDTFWVRWNDFNASGADDGMAIDDFSLSWSAPTAAQLTAAPSPLAFGSTAVGSTSAAKTYTLTSANLSDPTTLTATGPFVLSKDGSSGSYGTTLTYSVAELATPATVYVQFVPTSGGAVTGRISHSSGTASATVVLSGAGYDPNQTSFSFDACTGTADLSDGWLQYSVAGAQTWTCTTFGRNKATNSPTASAPYGVQINGFANGSNVENQDWLISPSLNLSATNFPSLTFWARSAFTGPSLAVRVSTNYTGSGDPSLATWTTISAILPTAGSDVWTQVGGLDLSAFKAPKVYVALVYTSGPSTGASRWTVDDIAVTNGNAAPAPALAANPTTLFLGNQSVSNSNIQTFNLSVANLTGNVTLTTSAADYQVAKAGGAFARTISLTPAELAGPTIIQVKFAPLTAGLSYAGNVSIATAGASTATVQLVGNSYDLNSSLEVVDWNMEWFGAAPSANVGPTNKDLQQANALKVMASLQADVFILQEVVSVDRLKQVVADLSAATGITYGYQASDFGSYADDPTTDAADYASAQKLAFVYNTAVVTNPTFQGLLRCNETDNCPAYNAWAGGRFPYMMTATVTLNGVAKQVRFIDIHAKANSTATSANDYQRRKVGADLLKAYLDANYPNDNILIAGDYNDVLNGTIATGVSPAVSSYSSFLNDAAGYVPLTLALANAGAQSTAGYPTVIDNSIASNELAAYYLPGSAAVRTDIASQIESYATTTTDHYPVFTRYSFSTPDLVISTPNQLVLNGIYNSITVTGTGSARVQAPVAVNTSLTVQGGGRLDTDCQPLTGPGTFTVADGGTLGICDAAGITTTGSTGAIQVTGTRSFSTAANYVYNGTAAQVTGLGLPSQVRELTTTNASNLTLSQPLTVAQTLTVASSGNVLLNNQALTLRSDAAGTALVVNSGTGTVQGATAAVQRYLDGSLNGGLGYRQLSAPVSGSTVADLATASFTPVVNSAYNGSAMPGSVQPYPTVYGYDESRLTTATNNSPAFDKGWYSPTSLSDALVVGKGYTVNLGARQVVDFVGALNNGDYTQTLTRQDQTADGGWQLLGNPYPASLDWSQVMPTDRPGLEAAVYVSQSTGQYANTYRSYVNKIGTPVLPVGQGFFVRVAENQTSATLALHNSQRVTSYATQVSVQRTTGETRPLLNLTLGTASGSADPLYVYAESGATAGFDVQQDAAKLPNATGLNLAALTSTGQPLSIQGLATLTGRVALRVQVPAAGTYSLTAAELLNLPAGTQPVLEDTKTGQRTPLTAVGSTYSFTVAAGEQTDGRFWLRLNGVDSPLATANPLQTELALYPNPTQNGQTTLLVPTGTGAGQVRVLDALGRLVREQALVVGGATTLKLDGLPAGVYLVRVQAGSEQATRRLTIN
ncbi:T9SS type A sorting domain-containing protein [Hymenobacter sp. BT559]|uniref:T9SS type A sorting domain-containing protein n=1 Tax=Hymenobacter sp. BT559 TaxID=2795729 RepID=UPI0018EDBF15|nr:T9SS type A sorting domain-containing protein [Hymenobacter sp. BT559]MBJ6143936.1 T9SS type A sorting domain-containing protein [Hymenobacter sp. BT559]